MHTTQLPPASKFSYFLFRANREQRSPIAQHGAAFTGCVTSTMQTSFSCHTTPVLNINPFKEEIANSCSGYLATTVRCYKAG